MRHQLVVLVMTGVAGAQTFAIQTLPASASMGNTVSVADVNGDQVPDLVLVGSSTIAVHLGDGMGGFMPFYQLPVQVFFGLQTAVADGNRDGKLDIWVAHGLGHGLLLGDGTGQFSPGGSLGSIGTPGTTFAVGDLDEDGDPDVVRGLGSLAVATALNDGSGSFGPLATLAQGSLGFSYTSFRIGDVNCDGHADILASGILPSFRILLGDGVGTFSSQYVVSTPGTMGLLTFADLDMDLDPDLVLMSSNPSATAPQVWRNDGAGNFSFVGLLPIPVTTRMEAGDIDGDGRVDLVGAAADSIVVLSGNGDCGFTMSSTTPTGAVRHPVLADFDRDGRVDIATVAQLGQSIVVLRNLLPTPPGIAAYGGGTAACGGTIGIHGAPEPAIGETAFRVLCSNAPPNATGLLAMGTPMTSGWDPFGIGLRLHLGFAFPVAAIHSDDSGVGSIGLPIPNIPWLVGLAVHVQTFWMGDPGLGNTCSPAAYELASSRGLTITVQP